MNHIHLASGIARRDDTILLVASSYESHAEPLWNLPGGRQEPHELLEDTVVREVHEETGLVARLLSFAYVAESYDGETHFTSTVFEIAVEGELALPAGSDHVVAAEWVNVAQLAERIAPRVVREPLLAYLTHGQRYTGYPEAGISIRWRSNT